jgi:hypothetical protein
MTWATPRSPLGRLSSGSSGAGGRASIVRSSDLTQGREVTYSRAWQPCGGAAEQPSLLGAPGTLPQAKTAPQAALPQHTESPPVNPCCRWFPKNDQR